MLKGIKSNNNQFGSSTKREEMEAQALRRFLEASSKKADESLQKTDEIKMKTRRKLIDNRDDMAMERILGDNDLLPISYMQTGLKSSESVCRIVIRNRAGAIIGCGTGFLVSPEVILTNNHVLPNIEMAESASAQFNYQNDENFTLCTFYEYSFEPERFFITDKKLDFTLVALTEKSKNGKSLKDFPFIQLFSDKGKILNGEYVSIIQHPNGGTKSVTLRENKVEYIFDDFIHYLTDTEPGSSGSPVFNDQWVAVALHHSGVPSPDKKGEWIANEGVRISSIAEFIKKEYEKFDDNSKKIIEEVFMDLKEYNDKNKVSEKEKKEKGYDPLFLGEDYIIDLPKLSEEMEEDSSKMDNGSNVLDYVHFSIVMCKSRGLAYFTAVNIDGKRKVQIPRSDKWFYDNRISEKYQYGNEVYSKNDLDRGHLVRRKDPNWGEESEARQANLDTFHYTNSAPQHKDLNQKIWLGLEDYVLNNAQNSGLKISVFTGPVFKDDDMVYRKKYKIPAEFWKVVVMVKEDGDLSATAYIQTQQNMIEELEFVYGAYKTYQVPIAKIEEITGLDFGNLPQYDPIGSLEVSGLLISEVENIRL